jgi:hypothetical protein
MAMGQPKGKPALGLLIGVDKPGADEMAEPEEDGKVMAFRALRKAFEAKDDSAGADALAMFIEHLDGEMVEEDEEPSDETAEPPAF